MVLSDYHGAEDILPALEEAIENEEIELIAYCGDTVKGYARGDEWLASLREKRKPRRDLPSIKDEAVEDELLYRKFFFNLNGFGIPVVAIPGNMDAPVERYQKAISEFPNIQDVHGKIFRYNGFTFFGYGGEIGDMEEKELVFISKGEDVLKLFEQNLKGEKEKPIFLLHQPPVSKIDIDPKTQKHIGSPFVNKIIEKHNPLFVFCGHAHAGAGQDTIGNTLVINPGALKKGRYAVLDTDSKRVYFPSPLKIL